jgi:hypothetical protein
LRLAREQRRKTGCLRSVSFAASQIDLLGGRGKVTLPPLQVTGASLEFTGREPAEILAARLGIRVSPLKARAQEVL